MWLVSFFVGVLSLAHARDESKDGSGEQALLRVRGRSQPPTIDITPLLESVQAVITNVVETCSYAYPEMVAQAQASVSGALAQMTPQFDDEHGCAQDDINHQFGEVEACSSSSDGGSVIGDLADQVAATKECEATATAAEERRQSECNEWTNHANHLAFPSTAVSASSTAEQMYRIAESLKDWVQDEWPAVESQHADCADAKAHLTDCSTLVAQYAETFCQHRRACDLIDACHTHELGIYNALVSHHSDQMDARQAQYRRVKEVECATLYPMSYDESSLNTCKENVNVDHLVLEFPQPEALRGCRPLQPGDPDCSQVSLPLAWDDSMV